MEKLTICKTNKGRYAVRPMSWAGAWDDKGLIEESLNHLAIFCEKEDAEKFVAWKKAEEQRRLLELPFAVGDMVWIIKNPGEVSRYQIFQICISPDQTYFCCYGDCFKLDQINKTVFFTREEAWAAMKKIQG